MSILLSSTDSATPTVCSSVKSASGYAATRFERPVTRDLAALVVTLTVSTVDGALVGWVGTAALNYREHFALIGMGKPIYEH